MAAAPESRDAAAADGTIVRGFRLLRLPLVAGSAISRSLLVKRHEGRTAEEKAAAGRTLFVTHLDSFVTEAHLSRCFASFGAVEKVELKSTRKKASKAEQRADNVHVHVIFARVVFCEDTSLQKALAAATGRIAGTAVLALPSAELKEQMKAAKAFYRDPAELRKEVDAFMAAYDEREEEKKRIARETAVDDDGFIKVVSGTTRADGFTIRSARRPSLKTGAFAEPINGMPDPESLEGAKKKKAHKKKEKFDFYRSQLREQKRQEIVSHRKRKAEDLEKVERMRQKKRKAVQEH